MKRAAHSPGRSLEIAFLKAKAAQHRGDLPEARRLYTAILSAFPKNARAKRGLESLARQQSAHVSGPGDGELGELIAWHKAGRFEDVISGARSLLARHPNSIPLYDLIGSGSAMLGRVNDAIEAYRKAAEINPGLSEAHNNLGVQLLNAGHIHEATASFKSAIRLSATNALREVAQASASPAAIDIEAVADIIASFSRKDSG